MSITNNLDIFTPWHQIQLKQFIYVLAKIASDQNHALAGFEPMTKSHSTPRKQLSDEALGSSRIALSRRNLQSNLFLISNVGLDLGARLTWLDIRCYIVYNTLYSYFSYLWISLKLHHCSRITITSWHKTQHSNPPLPLHFARNSLALRRPRVFSYEEGRADPWAAALLNPQPIGTAAFCHVTIWTNVFHLVIHNLEIGAIFSNHKWAILKNTPLARCTETFARKRKMFIYI
jgi:hypothetical protein